MKITKRKLRLLLEKYILNESADLVFDLTNVKKLADSKKPKDIVGIEEYVELFDVGLDTDLGEEVAKGSRIGVFGEKMLLGMITAGLVQVTQEGYNNKEADDTNGWVDLRIFLPKSPVSVSGQTSGGRPTGRADSVGVDAWVPTKNGWGSIIKTGDDELPEELDIGKAGLGLSMKMSTATTSAGSEVIQKTKFATESGIKDIGEFLALAFIIETEGVDPEYFDIDTAKITSPGSYGPHAAKLLHNKGVKKLKFKGCAYNGGVAQSEEITSEITVNTRRFDFKSEGKDISPSFKNLMTIINGLVNNETKVQEYLGKNTVQAKVQYLRQLAGGEGGENLVGTLQSAGVATLALGTNDEDEGTTRYQFFSRPEQATSATPKKHSKNILADDGPIQKVLQFLQELNPTLALSFTSSNVVEYTLKINEEAGKYSFSYDSGEPITTAADHFPNKDLLLYFGAYGDNDLSFIRALGGRVIEQLPFDTASSLEGQSSRSVDTQKETVASALGRARSEILPVEGGMEQDLDAMSRHISWVKKLNALILSCLENNSNLFSKDRIAYRQFVAYNQQYSRSVKVIVTERKSIIAALKDSLDKVNRYVATDTNYVEQEDVVVSNLVNPFDRSISELEGEKLRESDAPTQAAYGDLIDVLTAIKNKIQTKANSGKILKEVIQNFNLDRPVEIVEQDEISLIFSGTKVLKSIKVLLNVYLAIQTFIANITPVNYNFELTTLENLLKNTIPLLQGFNEIITSSLQAIEMSEDDSVTISELTERKLFLENLLRLIGKRN